MSSRQPHHYLGLAISILLAEMLPPGFDRHDS
jgi:hypothetical protein